MSKLEVKKGISLIVLVITIIVMIILATAIILTLDSSNIADKAKEAKTASDLANAKNVVILAKGEWELMTESERVLNGGTFKAYANSKLQEAGFELNGENAYGVTEEGQVVIGIAAQFINNNVPIGATITGYTLRGEEEYKTYTTSGKENTYDSYLGVVTEQPQPTNVSRDESVIWNYIGIDNVGNALLVGSVTETTPKISLAGKNAYLSAAGELDLICSGLYSTDMGNARSIDIDDVIRVLEYTGEKGSYYSKVGNQYIPTQQALKISEIEEKAGYKMLMKNTPNDEKIETYISNYFYIDKEKDAQEFNTQRSNIIYPSNELSNLKFKYWLASNCVSTYNAGEVYEQDYGSSGASDFGIRMVNDTKVDFVYVFESGGGEVNTNDNAIRPVIELNTDVQLKQENGSWVIYK